MPKSAPVPRKKGKEKEGEGKKGRVEKKKDRTKRKRTTDTSPDTTPLTEDPPIPLRPTKKKKVKSDKLAKEKDEAQKAFAKDQELFFFPLFVYRNPTNFKAGPRKLTKQPRRRRPKRERRPLHQGNPLGHA